MARAAPRAGPKLVTSQKNVDPMVAAQYARAEADHAQALAAIRIAEALEAATLRLGPAADAIHNLSVAQEKLCAFLVKHRMKLALSVPVILTLVQAISPNAAAGLAEVIKTLAPIFTH